jgi:hypothetical protein
MFGLRFSGQVGSGALRVLPARSAVASIELDLEEFDLDPASFRPGRRWPGQVDLIGREQQMSGEEGGNRPETAEDGGGRREMEKGEVSPEDWPRRRRRFSQVAPSRWGRRHPREKRLFGIGEAVAFYVNTVKPYDQIKKTIRLVRKSCGISACKLLWLWHQMACVFLCLLSTPSHASLKDTATGWHRIFANPCGD